MATEQPYLLPVWDTITTSWQKVHGSKSTVWGAYGMIFLIVLGLGILAAICGKFLPALGGLITIISQALSTFLMVGLIYIGIKRAFDLPITYKMIFNVLKLKTLLYLIGLYFLSVIIFFLPTLGIVGGTFLCHAQFAGACLLGTVMIIVFTAILIYLVYRLYLSWALVLDKEMGPWQAIKVSYKATRENIWRIIGIKIVLFLIIAISMLPLGIGLIWTIPLALIVYGVIYKRLLVNVQFR